MPKSVLRAVLGRIQFTLHATRRTPHGASRLVQAMSAWLVKTRRAPSRHTKGARAYCHTTMAMHKLSTPPPSKKGLPAIADRVEWEKITKGRAGTRWDNVVEKIWKDLGGGAKRGSVYKEVWRGQDKNRRIEERKRQALRNKVEEEKHLRIYWGFWEDVGMETYLRDKTETAIPCRGPGPTRKKTEIYQ